MTEEQAKAIVASLRGGAKFVGVNGAFLNASCVSGIYPDEVARQEATVGRLHDGVRVVRKFGRWVDANNEKVNLSMEYYPELAQDRVMDEETWNREMANLESTDLIEERYYKVMIGRPKLEALPEGRK